MKKCGQKKGLNKNILSFLTHLNRYKFGVQNVGHIGVKSKQPLCFGWKLTKTFNLLAVSSCLGRMIDIPCDTSCWSGLCFSECLFFCGLGQNNQSVPRVIPVVWATFRKKKVWSIKLQEQIWLRNGLNLATTVWCPRWCQHCQNSSSFDLGLAKNVAHTRFPKRGNKPDSWSQTQRHGVSSKGTKQRCDGGKFWKDRRHKPT